MMSTLRRWLILLCLLRLLCPAGSSSFYTLEAVVQVSCWDVYVQS
jgi:hypothetical protein